MESEPEIETMGASLMLSFAPLVYTPLLIEVGD